MNDLFNIGGSDSICYVQTEEVFNQEELDKSVKKATLIMNRTP
jgi:hypothetical protein